MDLEGHILAKERDGEEDDGGVEQRHDLRDPAAGFPLLGGRFAPDRDVVTAPNVPRSCGENYRRTIQLGGLTSRK